MLIEVIETNNTYYIDHSEIQFFDMKIGDDVLLADIAEYVYDQESMADDYDAWIKDNTEEYLDQVYMSYVIYYNEDI